MNECNGEDEARVEADHGQRLESSLRKGDAREISRKMLFAQQVSLLAAAK